MPARSFWQSPRSPLAGLDAREQYEAVRWGLQPRRLTVVQTPALQRAQGLVQLGRLRALVLELDGEWVEVLKPPRPYPHLAFGERDNRLYIVGGSTGALARRRAWGAPGSRQRIMQVDYDARKGRKTAYWYHEHEPPYPWLVVLPNGYPAYQGGRYKVAPEGITG